MTDDMRLHVYDYEEAVDRAESIGAATSEQVADIDHHARERTEELFEEHDLEYTTEHGEAVVRHLLSTAIDRYQRGGDPEIGRLASELSTEGVHGAILVAIGMELTTADEPSEDFVELYDRALSGGRL